MQDRYKGRLIALFKRRLPSETKVYLFGSRARGDSTISSDIDLAFEFVPDDFKLNRLKDEIEDLNIPFSVDLVDLGKVAKEFYEQVKSDAIVWID